MTYLSWKWMSNKRLELYSVGSEREVKCPPVNTILLLPGSGEAAKKIRSWFENLTTNGSGHSEIERLSRWS